MTEYYHIGRIVAVHGLKGEMLLQHELGKKTSLKGLAAIYTEEKNKNFLPWFPVSAKSKSPTEIFLTLEGVSTREAAMKWLRKKIWITASDYKKFAAPSTPTGLLGYTVRHGEEALGEIQEVIEQPHQLLCRLEIKGKEVLIPLHEGSLLRMDHEKKVVQVTLPDGLLDIYLK